MSTITRIPNPEHERMVLATRAALGIVPVFEGFVAHVSGSDPKGEDGLSRLSAKHRRAARSAAEGNAQKVRP
jgi:hypothetical protein